MSSDRPMASALAKPKIRSAPGLQKMIAPSLSAAMIASAAPKGSHPL